MFVHELPFSSVVGYLKDIPCRVVCLMMKVNGLDLPKIVHDLIVSKRWNMPSDPAILGEVFQDFATPCHSSGPTLYLPKQMQSETTHWLGLAKAGSVVVGTPDPDNLPGDIDPSRTVLIGDVGIGWDAPFALDYRASENHPRVIHFARPADHKHNRWVEIAPTIESFVGVLKLSAAR